MCRWRRWPSTSRRCTPINTDLVTRVQAALRDHAGPEMGLDGSLIEVVEVTDGIASVRLAGACASCPASLTTIILGLEQELRKHVPEVDIIEAVG